MAAYTKPRSVNSVAIHRGHWNVSKSFTQAHLLRDTNPAVPTDVLLGQVVVLGPNGLWGIAEDPGSDNREPCDFGRYCPNVKVAFPNYSSVEAVYSSTAYFVGDVVAVLPDLTFAAYLDIATAQGAGGFVIGYSIESGAAGTIMAVLTDVGVRGL